MLIFVFTPPDAAQQFRWALSPWAKSLVQFCREWFLSLKDRVSHTFVIVYSIEFGIVLPVAREQKVNSTTCKYQPAKRVMIVSLSSL